MKRFNLPDPDMEVNKTVVRLKRGYYSDKRGNLHLDISLSSLLRKSQGSFNILYEEIAACGEEEVYNRIINVNDCEDGVYEIVSCNHSYDYETMYCDDYDLKLVKYKEIER